MKFYKMEVYVFDFEDTPPSYVIDSIEENRYRIVKVMQSESVDIDWTDDHELNKGLPSPELYRKYFETKLNTACVVTGGEIHAGDGGYQIGTQEAYDEFNRKRNYKIPGG